MTCGEFLCMRELYNFYYELLWLDLVPIFDISMNWSLAILEPLHLC